MSRLQIARFHRYGILPKNPALLAIPVPTPPEPSTMITEDGLNIMLTEDGNNEMITENDLE
jgi:hypothetical protein